MRQMPFINNLKCNLKEAELLISRNSLKRAKFLLKSTIDLYETSSSLSSCHQSPSIEVYIKSLDLYAQLLNDTKSENPTQIISQYLEKSIASVKALKNANASLCLKANYSLARFADEQYVKTCAYLRSSEFEAQAELMRKFGSDANKIELIEPNSYFKRILCKQFDMDREDVRLVKANKEAYLGKAIKCYLKCLLLSAGSEDVRDNACVFRLVSLWTENTALVSGIEQMLLKIPTHKFCILLHQLAARMSLKEQEQDKYAEFQRVLIQLITNIATQHPHHALPILFAFVNSLKDSEDSESCNINSDRINTANHIIKKLKLGPTKEIIDSMSRLCEAYIELANFKGTQTC